MIRVFTAFSGYDSQCLALERLKANFPTFDYELIGWSEIDKYAIQAHNALFPQWTDRNYGDISLMIGRKYPTLICSLIALLVKTSLTQDCNEVARKVAEQEARYCGNVSER